MAVIKQTDTQFACWLVVYSQIASCSTDSPGELMHGKGGYPLTCIESPPPPRPGQKRAGEPSALRESTASIASDVNVGTCLTNCIDHPQIDTVFMYKGKIGTEEPSAPS